MISKIFRLIIAVSMMQHAVCTAADGDVRSAAAKLKSATVFLHGAELTHTVETVMTKGDNELYIDKLSPNIDEGSIKISVTGGTTIVSHGFTRDYLAEAPAGVTVRRLQDSIKMYGDELSTIHTMIEVNENLTALLKANNSIGGTQTGVSVDELMKMMEYYKSKSTELAEEISEGNIRKKKIDERIAALTRQLDLEKRRNDKISGRLYLKLLSTSAGTCAITISYYTEHASWEPCYDLQMNGTDAPLRIVYKADIRQTTGLDWDKVQLTLSTITPSNGKVAPVPEAWFLRRVPIIGGSDKTMQNAVQNSMSYALEGRAAGVAVTPGSGSQLKIRGMANVDDSAQPLYVIDGIVASQSEMKAIDPSRIKSIDVLKDASATAIYGSRAAGGVIIVTTKSEMEDYVTSEESEIDAVYRIELLYTIAGNGNPQNVTLRTADAAAEYRYYCVPKLDRAVFLTASIRDREKLNLLPGRASITIEGSYTGTTFIDPNTVRATLDLTLGQDSRVSVKREKMQDMSSVRFLGSDVRQEFAYRTTVVNNRTAPVKMIVKDQYPLSTQKDYAVEVLGFTGAPHENKDVGTLTWEFDLAPGKPETFDLRYSVKYPRGVILNL